MHRNALRVPEENLAGRSQSMAREDGVRFMGYRGSVLEGRTLFVAVAGVVAALLVWSLTAAPALAQAKAGNVDFQAVDCSQVQAAVAGQYNSGDAVAVQQYDSGTATAEIAQALGIDQSQVNDCLSNGGTNSPGSKTKTPGDTNNPNDIVPGTKSVSELPNTGGAPLSGVVAGFALVAAGILSVGLTIRRGR
ncbi:MAG TPA: hypothetical protein VF068_09400 [Rubrobacter sp.]